MKYEKDELLTRMDRKGRSAEVDLLAEILSWMDEKQKNEFKTQQQLPDKTISRHTIDLLELFYDLLSKWYLILLGMVLGGMLMGYYAAYKLTPDYIATSKLYIMGTQGNNIAVDLQVGSELTMDYQEVFRTWEVHQMVNEELGTNYDYFVLQSMISVTNPEDTRVLYIRARHPDAQTAADIANAYASAAKRFIVQTMHTDEPATFSLALVPSLPSGVGVRDYVIRGALLGMVLVGGLLVLVFLLDTRPKSPGDIRRYANIPTLAVIPENQNLSQIKTLGRKAGSI